MKKKIFAVLAAAFVAASMFACGAQAETRKVIVGTTGTGEPYTYVADDGTWTGVEAELWGEVEKRTGWNIEMKQVADMASLFGELNTGRVDVAANCFAITETRLKNYLASIPIYADAQVIIVKPESKYKTFEDLRGQTMGVTAGQAAQTTVENMAPEYDWKVITYEDSPQGFLDCANGRIESYRDELNKVLREMHKDGTLSRITTKWFYDDLTKLISDQWLIDENSGVK